MCSSDLENVKVIVGDLSQVFPERFGGVKENEQSKPEATTVSFGMSIQNLSEQQRSSLGVKEKGGVQVVEIEPDSFAEEVGLLQGDIILSLNRQPVSSTEDIKKIQATLKPGDAVAFHVIRKLRGRSGGGDWQSSYLAGTLSTNPR